MIKNRLIFVFPQPYEKTEVNVKFFLLLGATFLEIKDEKSINSRVQAFL